MLSNTTVRATYQGDGNTTTFAIPFAFIRDDSVETKVYVRDESVDPATETLQVEGSMQDYELTGAQTVDDFNTDVEFNSAPGSQEKVIIIRERPLTQSLDLTTSGQYKPESQELNYDDIVAMIQELDERVNRAPTQRITSQDGSLEFPELENENFLRVDKNGNLEWFNIPEITGGAGELTSPADGTYGDGQNRANVVDGDNVEDAFDKVVSLQDKGSYFRKFTVSHANFQTASTTNTISLFTASSYEVIEYVVVKHSTSFSGGSISSYDIEIGPSGDADKYMRSFDVFQSPSDSTKKIQQNTDVESFSSSTGIEITATSQGDNLDQSSQGDLTVWVKTAFLPS